MLRRIALLAIALVAAGRAPALADGTVTVVHGVPGLTVDVYVNGALTLPGFVPGTVTPPLDLPADTYDVVIVPAGGDPANPAIAGSAALADGDNVSLVAHLTAAGAPTLSVFANDTAGIPAGASRLAVRHTAAAPAVDVALVKRRFGFPKLAGLLEDLTNPNEATVDVRAGTYEGYVLPAGRFKPVLAAAKLALEKATFTAVYAVGSPADDTFMLLVQTIGAPAPEPGPARVSVVHGVPGVPVDVYVNGALTLEDFQPGTVTDPLSLPAGEYEIDVVPADGDPAAPVIEGTAVLAAGDDATVVAHLTETGGLTLSVFANDLDGLKPWQSRVVVRHVAAAPAVDVALYRRWRWWSRLVALITGLTNPEEASADVLAGRHRARIRPAGSKQTVFGPVPLTLAPRTVTIVYAIGSLGDGSFTLLTQTLPATH